MAPKHMHMNAGSKHTTPQGGLHQAFIACCSEPCPVVTFVLRVAASAWGGRWAVDAGRGTALGRMSIITY